jgi:CBS domain-containing protein
MQAAAVMLKHKISGVPIVDTSGILVGIVTEGDFLRRAEIKTQRRRRRWIEFLIGQGVSRVNTSTPAAAKSRTS